MMAEDGLARESVIPIKYNRIERLTDLFGDAPADLQLAPSAANLPFAELLLPHLSDSEIHRTHHQAGQIAPVLLSAIPRAIVSGRSVVGTQDSVYLTGDPVPLYVDNYLRDRKAPPDTLLRPKEARSIPGVSVLVTHWNSSIYGHWLLEGLPKLFLLRQAGLPIPYKIVTPSTCGPFVREWAAFVLPGVAVDIFDDRTESVLCEHLLLPSWLGARTHDYHPALNDMIDNFGMQPDTGGQIYVSREQENPHRSLANKAEIEDIATRAGYRVVVPEQLPIPEQFRLFRSASNIVGPFGSAMHNAIFSPRGSTVFCLNWVGVLQSKIAHLRQHRVGYMLDQTAQPIAYDRSNPTHREVTIDQNEFRRALGVLAAA